jgi:hypothetical protein
MSLTNVAEDGLLALFFQNANYANVGDATGLRGSSTAGVFYVSLHTANPNETGSQNTSEAAYTAPYARQSVARSSAGWDEASSAASNHSAITYPACTGGSETETHFGIGSDSSAAGHLFIWGALTSSLAVSNGITPSFAAGALDVTLD